MGESKVGAGEREGVGEGGREGVGEGGGEGEDGREREGVGGREGCHGRRRPGAGKIVIFVLMGAVGVALFGLVVMGLWNALIPAILAGPEITWIQALGLFALSRILFGGWGGGRHRRHDGGHWRGRWQRKLDGLSPEERERIKAMMMRGRPGHAAGAQ